MESINRFNHASSQAPWRTERQWISVSLLIVLGFAIIATLYLTVSSQAGIVGREIQDLRLKIIETEQKNADLQSQLARLTSKNEIDRRAYELRFRPIKPQELEYLYVPGLAIPDGTIFATVPELQPDPHSIPPEYTQSLLEWLDDSLQASSRGLR